jgi:hypothetical protein
VLVAAPCGPTGVLYMGNRTTQADGSLLQGRYQAIIKVNSLDPPERRSADIESGIGYAAMLLLDEYGWTADRIAEVLERAIDVVRDEEEMRRG